MMNRILITGATGFIGSALCHRLATGNKVIGVDIAGVTPSETLNIIWEQIDLTDFNSAATVCEKYSPDIVIHCAGIA
ncbi:MAG: NAD-dependent epimerase/dehydratase family protein, partial [Sedimentisphaerales bacterium]|nr:NAD-dependent epimerase/dehydratase family protein [Sedimentisphaerales bacterium]